MFAKALYISLIIAIANAAVGIIPIKLSKTPKELAHKVGCYIEEIYDVIPFNETVPLLGVCESRTCYEDHIKMTTCGSLAPKAGCFLTEKDYSRPYSQCCPQIRCDLGENEIAE